MAKSNAVWGIDVGQCALKALRCRPHEKDSNRIVAESFDYIEYPKILSQPEADRTELVREALALFVERNDVMDDQVAISVSGQSGLARFIKLPPVESKKIPDIVKYEARQQIPFSLEDVVWDYQQLVGGSEEEGFALETEVGLFAMKRDQVTRSLQPFEEAGIQVDYIQLSPLSIFNFLCFDRLGSAEKTFNPAEPPASTVVISLGTDTTDLVVTNGYRVWQRNIPIGGNHFTKSLSRELKLTFDKAEHLKRNASDADDPKSVFQAMRPIFSDLLGEVQRSISFFSNIDKTAEIGEIVAIGNALKLPGLKRYLEQNLDQPVKLLDDFEHLVGGTVTAGPQFKENVLSFGVAYGLCIQGLSHSQLSTNLLPEEMITRRLIAAKKPWAVAAAAAVLIGCTVNYVAGYTQWKSADIQGDAELSKATKLATDLKSKSGRLQSEWQAQHTTYQEVTGIKDSLLQNQEGRLQWLEVVKAVSESLPHDERDPADRKITVADISGRPELHITKMDCQYFEDLSTWYAGVEHLYNAEYGIRAAETQPPPAAAGDEPTQPGEDPESTPAEPAVVDEPTAPEILDDFASDPSAPGLEGEEEGVGGPEGTGWVIELIGHHFHNGDKRNEGATFVAREFLQRLEEGSIVLPDGPNGAEIEVKVSELGISHPVIVDYQKPYPYVVDIEASDEDEGSSRPPTVGEVGEDGRPLTEEQLEKILARRYLELKKFDFIIQIAWTPTPRSVRNAKRIAELEAEAAGADDSVSLPGTSDELIAGLAQPRLEQ